MLTKPPYLNRLLLRSESEDVINNKNLTKLKLVRQKYSSTRSSQWRSLVTAAAANGVPLFLQQQLMGFPRYWTGSVHICARLQINISCKSHTMYS